MDYNAITEELTAFEVRSCLISHQGSLVLEHYREPQLKQDIAKINSCTKSIVSALVCIAIDKGLLPQPETPIATFFPSLADDPDPQKKDITIAHLLTMSAGFRWQEFKGINSFPNMIKTPNWIDYTLSQPLSHQPGTYMEYNSGCSQILSALVYQTSDYSTAQFAEQYLFGPLGIEDYEWEYDPHGVHTGGFGLKLKPEDMLKFGQLYLQKGMWNGAQIISEDMVNRSIFPSISTNAPRRGNYGWHWWVDSYNHLNQADSSLLHYYYALGFGGQNIFVIPSHDLVVVITKDQTKKGKPPVDIFRQCIAPRLA